MTVKAVPPLASYTRSLLGPPAGDSLPVAEQGHDYRDSDLSEYDHWFHLGFTIETSTKRYYTNAVNMSTRLLNDLAE